MEEFGKENASTKCRICGRHHTEPGSFEMLGIMARFPFFLIMAVFKVVIVLPLEFLIFKVAGSCVLLVLSTIGVAKAVVCSDRREFKEHKSSIKEIGELFFDLEALDFSKVIHFLRYGSLG